MSVRVIRFAARGTLQLHSGNCAGDRGCGIVTAMKRLLLRRAGYGAPDHGAADPMVTPAPAPSVRAYYEQNSVWFRWVGRRYGTFAIHRPVWATGVDDLQTALNYVNARIADQVCQAAALRDDATIRLADLGCGYGGTVQYLVSAGGPSVWAVGVTVSAAQAQTAQRLAQAQGVHDRCAFVEADFQALPLQGPLDVIVSVEAFAHATQPERYFAEVSRLLAPGGRLVLCDDFRAADTDAHLTARQRRLLALFQSGWHIPHLLSAQQTHELARRHGLQPVEEVDLSPSLRLRNFSDAWLPLFEQAMRRAGPLSHWVGSVVGGWALESAIHRGLTTYRLLVYTRAA